MILKNIHPFVTYVDSTFILPGTQTIPEEKARQLAISPAFQEKVKSGALIIVNNDGNDNIEVKSTPGTLPVLVNKIGKTDISKMSVSAAVKVIKDMYNVSELRLLLKKEIRRNVKLAIKTQLKNIDESAKEKEETTSSENVYED